MSGEYLFLVRAWLALSSFFFSPFYILSSYQFNIIYCVSWPEIITKEEHFIKSELINSLIICYFLTFFPPPQQIRKWLFEGKRYQVWLWLGLLAKHLCAVGDDHWSPVSKLSSIGTHEEAQLELCTHYYDVLTCLELHITSVKKTMP